MGKELKTKGVSIRLTPTEYGNLEKMALELGVAEGRFVTITELMMRFMDIAVPQVMSDISDKNQTQKRDLLMFAARRHFSRGQVCLEKFVQSNNSTDV